MNPVGVPSFIGTFFTSEAADRPCVVTGRSVDELSITGDGMPAPGRLISCRVAVLGLLHARIGGASDETRKLSLTDGPSRRDRIAARIAWHRARLEGGPDLRSDTRVVPTRSAVSVRWPGWEGDGTLLDVSAGGAAVDIAVRPAIGAPITIGMRRGVVVRHTEGGIALRFVLPLRPEDVREGIVL